MNQFSLTPALCLDLDGTVRYSKNGNRFIEGPSDVAIYSDVESKLWQFRDNGWLIFGISNQGGVAFGHKTWDDAQEEVKTMCFLFAQNPFHSVQQCFHHEGGTVEPYCHRSLFRKPHTGMLAWCEYEAFGSGFIVDWDNSLFVGDRPEDQECAANAGISFQWANVFFEREAA